MVTTREALTAVPTASGGHGLRFGRTFTQEGVHPYDTLEWEERDAVINDWRTGEISFEQRGVEFPKSWSMNATTIVAQKYFRGQPGTPERERSVRHMIDRVADTIAAWGEPTATSLTTSPPRSSPTSSSTCSSTRWPRSTPRSGSTSASRTRRSARRASPTGPW